MDVDVDEVVDLVLVRSDPDPPPDELKVDSLLISPPPILLPLLQLFLGLVVAEHY